MKKITLLLFVLLSAIGFSQELVTCGEGASFEPLYGNQGMYTYSFQSADGVSPLKLSIIAGIIGTGSGQDSFQIFDGEDWSGALLFYATDGFYLSGTEVTSTGPNIFIVITGDESGSNFDGIVNDFIIGEVTCDAIVVCEAPTDLTATNITATTAEFSWTDNNVTPNGWWISVDYGQSSSDVYTELNPFFYTDLQPNTEYTIKVITQCGSSSFSEASEEVTFTTAAAEPCLAPTDVSATNITATTVDLSWSANGEATEWLVDVKDAEGWGPPYTNSITTSINVTDLEEGTLYTARVFAYCNGEESLEYATYTFTTLPEAEPCLAPTDVSVTSISATTAEFSWTENGTATQWVVSFGAYGFNSETTVDTNSIEYTELVPHTGYSISVKAICGDGNESEWSEWLTVPTISTQCVVPTDVSATNITATTVDLSWSENGTATQWEVEYGVSGFTQGDGTTITATSNPINFTGLIETTDYEFYVRAICGSDDESEWSEAVTVTTIVDCSDVQGDTISDAITISSLPYNDSGATNECYTNTRNNSSADVFYNLTIADCTDQLTISLCGSNYDTYIRILSTDGTQLYSRDDNNGVCESVVSSHLVIDVINSTTINTGDTIIIMVEGVSDNEGDYILNVDATIACPPANDACANAEALTLGTEIFGDNINATDSGVTSACDVDEIADVWFSFVAPTSGNVTITSSAEYALFTNCTTTTALSCNTPEVTGLIAATTYYVRVTNDALLARSLEPGEFTLKVEDTAALSATDYSINSIKLYPNPTKGLVIIDNDLETELQISVYDIKGRLLLNKKLGLDTNSVDLSNFNNGVYLLKMKSEFGEISKRVIKK